MLSDRLLGFLRELGRMVGVDIPIGASKEVYQRFLHAGDAFADVRLSGPLFHRLSGWVFACLILCTFIDLARVQWRQHPRKS
jgi:hypothetical protein